MLFSTTATLASSRQCRLAFGKTTRAQFQIVRSARGRPATPQEEVQHLYSTKSTTPRLSESAKDSLRQTWARFGLDPAKSFNREEVKDAWKEHLSNKFGPSKYHDTAHSRDIAQINAQLEQVLATFYPEPGSTVRLADLTRPQHVKRTETSNVKQRTGVPQTQVSKQQRPRSNRQQRPHVTMDRNGARAAEKPSSTLRQAPVDSERCGKASLLDSEAPLQPMRRSERPNPHTAPVRARWSFWMPDDARAERGRFLVLTNTALKELRWVDDPLSKAIHLFNKGFLLISLALYPLVQVFYILWHLVLVLVAVLSSMASLLSRRR